MYEDTPPPPSFDAPRDAYQVRRRQRKDEKIADRESRESNESAFSRSVRYTLDLDLDLRSWLYMEVRLVRLHVATS